ncbi:MAG: FtsW/RodA/SpoVE family cell cycle protein [Caldimicrobium sp.]
MLQSINTFVKENLFACLSFIGLVFINILNQWCMGETGLYFWKNFLWQVIGLIIFILVWLKYDYKRVSLEFLWLIYGMFLVFLFILAIFKKRWLVIGPISIQPSEFLKIILLYLISLYATKKQDLQLDNREVFFLLFLVALPLSFILPVDLDYAGIIFLIFFVFICFLGISKKLLLIFLTFSLISIITIFPFAWSKLKPHQKGRIYGYLEPEKYAKTWGYQINQSLIAIGSGGPFGQGFKKGWSTRLNYLPAKNTDLAFAVWAEAFGLLGSTLFLGLYSYLLYWGLTISKKAKDLLGKYLSLGIVLLLLGQLFFNLGGATGLLPMTSIPQPFLSYGGSITISTYLLLSFLFNIAFKKDFFK